VKRR
jgi:hypothetical protein